MFLSSAKAQQPLQFSFTHYSTGSGLISNQLNTIVQDKEGYLWIGSTDGLQRFDGIRYKTFQHSENDTLSIPSNPVWQLLLDKKNNLWLLFADGKVGIFDTRRFTFREIPARFRKAVSPDTFIKRLITDEYGNMFYLMGGSEVITWDENAGEFSYTYNFFKNGDDGGIVDFIQQPGTRKYWISLEKGGLAVFNRTTGNLSRSGANSDKESVLDNMGGNVSYNHLFFDRQQRLWMTSDGSIPAVYYIDMHSGKPVLEKTGFDTYLKTFHNIKGFFQQQDGIIWVNGLLVFAKFQESEKQFRFVFNGYQNEKGISYEMIHCLYEDREKNIWVCTDNNGLYRFNPSREFFTNIKHINRETGNKGEASLRAFVATRRGTILAATWGDGIYQYDKNLNPIPVDFKGMKNPGGLFVWSMYASADSNIIWISSQKGMYALNQANRTAKFYNPPILENKTVRQIAEDKNGNLWLGTQNYGLFKWKSVNGKTRNEKEISLYPGMPAVAVNKLTIDSRGYLWVATPETGVYVIDPETDKVHIHFSDKGEGPLQLPEAGTSSVLEYDDSLMIITTATRIIRYNWKLNRSSLVGHSGIISGFITAMEKDNNGYLWLTSTNGLYRINLTKGIFVKFDRSDGIDNEQFIQSSSRILPDGRILFGSTNHIIAFDPAKIQKTTVFPDITVTDFKVKNISLPVDSLYLLKEIELGHQDNSLVVEFSPLLYNSAFLIKYKLEGLEKDWTLADKNQQAVYSYIPPGSYTFRLKVLDEEGNESSHISEMRIKVNAPFWKATWFYSLLALTLGGLLFWLDRERMNRKEAIQKMRSDIANDLHQEVNIALNNINVLSEMANLKAFKEPEKSKEYIEQIHSRSQNMMIAMDDMLWSIKPENDNMAKSIDRIKEHIDALRNRFGVKINLLVDQRVEALKLNMKLRKNIFWLLRSGSTNVIRSGATDCNIYIGVQKQTMLYTLEFNSSKMNMVQTNNLLQRQELADKLKEVNGVLNSRLQNTRSSIELTIPI